MFRFAKLNDNAVAPVKAHRFDAGFDLSACEDGIVPARGQLMINTGIAISIPTDCYARVAPRSGLAYKKCIDVMAGVIDHGYSDSVRVIIRNHADEPFQVKIGDRIAQLIFEKIYTPETIEFVTYVDIQDANNSNNSNNIDNNGKNIKNTANRGTAGFGSTGV